jgi:fructose transport system permease protein
MSKLTQEEAKLEASLSSAPTEVAEFAEQDGDLVRKAQHVLHQNPALVPLIVLIFSVVIFGAILGSNFLAPSLQL